MWATPEQQAVVRRSKQTPALSASESAIKSYVVGIAAGVAMALSSMSSDGALITTYDPDPTSTDYALSHSFENNDPGTYNHATSTLTKPLAQGLFDLKDQGYSSVDALANAELMPSFSSSGDNFYGWSSSSQNNGEVKFTNDGLVPEGTFNVWDTEKLALTTSVGYDLLELNGTGGHQAFTVADIQDGIANNSWDAGQYDAIVVRSDDARLGYLTNPLAAGEKTGTFTGFQDIDNEWTADSANYIVVNPNQIIPEPTTLALTGLAGIAAFFAQRRFRK